jgi:glycosyltransferase involved in cell wall biosynthesis
MSRVLVVSEKYWPEGGGAELATHRIVEYLSSKGFEITILTGTPNPSFLKNVEYVFEPLLRASRKVQLWTNCLVLKTTRKFKKMVESTDIVYIPGIAYPLALEIANKKIIVHLHNYQPIQYTQFIPAPYEKISDLIGTSVLDYYLGKFEYNHVIYGLGAAFLNTLNKLNIKAIKRAHTILCPSKRQEKIITSKIPELSSRFYTIPNPPPIISNTKSTTKSEIPTIIYAGGKSKVKGLHRALNVILQLATKKHKFEAYMLGLSTQPRVIKKYSSKILLYPKLSHQEVLHLLSRSWILLFPSIIEEPFPYIVYEAALLGTLPISTNTGGMFEILEGTIGQQYIVYPYDYQHIIEKINHVLSMSLDDLIKVSKTFALQMKEKYDENNIFGTYLKIFKGI